MYLENNLIVPGKLTACGEAVALCRIDLPSDVLATQEDHIVPWRSAYRTTQRVGGRSQFVQAFENLRHVLKAAGASLADVVDLNSFHTDMRELKLFMQIKDRYFVRDVPAWTAVGVASLGGSPGLVVEIKAVAVIADTE